MNILNHFADFYNLVCAVFNRGCENYWHTIPSGSKWIMVALFVLLIYEWGKRDGKRAVLRKLRERERRHERYSA